MKKHEYMVMAITADRVLGQAVVTAIDEADAIRQVEDDDSVLVSLVDKHQGVLHARRLRYLDFRSNVL